MVSIFFQYFINGDLNMEEKTRACILAAVISTLLLGSCGFYYTDIVSVGSIWAQTTDIDFNNGIPENVTVIGTGESAYLESMTSDFSWTLMPTSIAPPTRASFDMVYDDARKVSILFGGINIDLKMKFNDTWVYNLTSNEWTDVTPTVSPPARSNHAMVFDNASNLVVLFGGHDDNYNKFNDTWVYDVGTNTWTKRYPISAPAPRIEHAMAYDSINNLIVLFGGRGKGDMLFRDDTWIYDVSTNIWTNVTPPLSPSARQAPAMAFDSKNGVVVLFGGYNDTHLGDTWIYNVSTNIWVDMNPAHSPTPRHDSNIVYDIYNEELILFGGISETSFQNDTWIYKVDKNKWVALETISAPCKRESSGMIYDRANNKIVFFGGWVNWSVGYANDTWVGMKTLIPSGAFISSS